MEAVASRIKAEVRRQQYLAYNIASLTGFARLKPFDEHFPPLDGDQAAPAEPGGMSADGAKMLGALFRLKGRGVPMSVEKISLH